MYRKSLLGAVCLLFMAAAAGSVEFSSRAYECAPNNTVFVAGMQRWARLNNDSGISTNSYNPTAAALGYVYRQAGWYAGAALNYEHGNRRYDMRYSNADYQLRTDRLGVSLYGGITRPEGWYVDADAYLGVASYRPRDLTGPANNGDGDDFRKGAYAFGLEGGKDFDIGGNFVLTPHLGFDYAHTPSETHRFGSDYSRYIDSQNYFEIPVGVRFSKQFAYGNWNILPRVDLTMVNSIGDMDTLNDQPGFAYRTAKSWKVAGIGGGHIGGRVTAGVDAKVNDRTSLGLDYTYEGRKDYNDHRVSANVGWSF